MWNAAKLTEPTLGGSDIMEQVRKLLISFRSAQTQQWVAVMRIASSTAACSHTPKG